MKIFAIGDLHLSWNAQKPMDIFGENWTGHFERISKAWNALVVPEDIVLLPGDFSWAMRLEEALPDLEAVGALPGRKLLIRGNHDYWWNSLRKLRAVLPEGMYALQNDALRIDGVVVAGSRGWVCPGSANFDPKIDQKIYDREVQRLSLSLAAAETDKPLICMLHYPPFNERREPSAVSALLERHGVCELVYGHLHGKACRGAFEGQRNGVRYSLCSADHLDFCPKLIMEL